MEAINFAAGKLDFDGVDPELGLHLLSLHWNRQHHSFLLTYRPVFMRDMACGGKYFSKLLLNAIYYGASKFSPRRELGETRKTCARPNGRSACGSRNSSPMPWTGARSPPSRPCWS